MASILTTTFGRHARELTVVGLGGEGILRTSGQEKGAQAVIEEALSQGITYFDSARAYAGSESYYGRVWPNRPRDRPHRNVTAFDLHHDFRRRTYNDLLFEVEIKHVRRRVDRPQRSVD